VPNDDKSELPPPSVGETTAPASLPDADKPDFPPPVADQPDPDEGWGPAEIIMPETQARIAELESTVQAQYLALKVIQESMKRKGPPLDPVLAHLRILKSRLAAKGFTQEEISQFVWESLEAGKTPQQPADRNEISSLNQSGRGGDNSHN
jgi:hypothetical protein